VDVSITVRPARPADASEWARLRTALWPESPDDHPPEIAAYFEDPPTWAVCLLAEEPDGRIAGFAEMGLRNYAEGCATSPVGYLEGIWVEPDRRDSGVGRALVEAGAGWARSLGCRELASDRALDNEASGVFHTALGFDEVIRIVCYKKEL
jgi:aminoglycoside 6'-N-acetyltransferase I